MTELNNDEAVYRTAPATPGLLTTLGQITLGYMAGLAKWNATFCRTPDLTGSSQPSKRLKTLQDCKRLPQVHIIGC